VKPSLLIASPQMRDPFFEHTVVLLWHHDEHGAFGVVVNRPMEPTIPQALVLPDDLDLTPYRGVKVVQGGPVETDTGTVVCRDRLDGVDQWNLEGGLGVTRSLEVLLTLMRAGKPVMLCLGYAGWGPGQLDEELRTGGWLWTDCDAALVFDVPAADRYDRALATLGLTRTTVWMQPIDE
jgi:putative transcriptional regulator